MCQCVHFNAQNQIHLCVPVSSVPLLKVLYHKKIFLLALVE